MREINELQCQRNGINDVDVDLENQVEQSQDDKYERTKSVHVHIGDQVFCEIVAAFAIETEKDERHNRQHDQNRFVRMVPDEIDRLDLPLIQPQKRLSLFRTFKPGEF
jgi:hypothetical protein